MCKQAYRVASPMEAHVYVFVEYIIPHKDDNSYGIGLCIYTCFTIILDCIPIKIFIIIQKALLH